MDETVGQPGRRDGGKSLSRFAAQFPAWFLPYTIPLPALPWGNVLGARFGERHPFPEPRHEPDGSEGISGTPEKCSPSQSRAKLFSSLWVFRS